MCIVSGCPEKSGDDSRCDLHAAAHVEWMREHRRCIEPGCKDPAGSRSFCAAHKEARRLARKAAP